MLLRGSVSTMPLLRANLLEGRRIVLAEDAGEELGRHLGGLGAEIEQLGLHQLAADEDRVGDWARSRAPLHGLIYSAGAVFGQGGDDALRATLDAAWGFIREVAVGALIGADHPGKLVLVGPRADAGPLAEPVQAALENLARTLSVEWARYGVTAVMVAPGIGSSAAELATLMGFLVSEAGDYLSGCRLELGALG